MKTSTRISMIGLIALFLCLTFSSTFAQTTPEPSGESLLNPLPAVKKHAIEVSPMSPFMHIYVVQYSYQFSPENELMLGLSYMNIPYDDGATHSPGVIVGLRHYLWRGLHAEYQLWPAIDWFYEKHEKKYYTGFDLWNEARIGYRFDIKLSQDVSLYLTPQWAVGFGIYGTNKPDGFKEQVHENPFFGFPLVFVGIGF